MKKYILIALLMLIPFLLSAITLYVDDDYTSVTPGWGTTHFDEIQDAIEEYSTGDIVFVYQGTYYEAIDNYSDGAYIPVVIRSNYSVSGDWEDVEGTVIDAYNQGLSAIALSGNYDMEIDGFTIRRGIHGVSCTDDASVELLNCIVENNTNQNIGAGILVTTDGSINMVNCIVRNNKAENGGGLYSVLGPVTISDSKFYGNEATAGNGGAICFTYIDYQCRNLTISRSLFYENIADNCGGAIYYPGSINQDLFGIEIDFSTFTDNVITTGAGAKGIDLGSDNHDYYKSVLIENSIISEDSPNIDSVTEPSVINYCCIEGGCDDVNAILTVCDDDDPKFVSAANDDYHIKWGSPCIDTADPAADEDDDYSRADKGCYPYIRDHFNMSARYRWVCYPRMDVSDGVNNGENDDYLYPNDAMDHFWNDVPDDVYIYDEEDFEPPYEALYGGNINENLIWDDNYYQFFSYKGIKVCAGEQFYIGGYLMDPDYEFDDLDEDEDNWLGYFLEESQHVEDAIASGFMDNLLEIRTQTWSLIRANTIIEWQISVNYTFNYGDLVILKPEVTISDFKWQQPSRDISEPVYRPHAEYFSFEDEIDYMSIIAEFSPEDMPREVAIYVNDVCKGAQVVEDTLCQICAYILEEEPGSEIEFAFYDGERSFRSRNYIVLDNITGKVTGNDLVTGTAGSYYYVSFKDDAELPPAIKYNVKVTPNPFNPSTAICFELEDESEIKLSIYNVKGQIVKTLINETYRPGEYQVIWDGDDLTGKKMSSGVYFYRMQCGIDVINGKMLMLK